MKKKHTKKLDYDKTIKKVESISNKVDIIMCNRLIIAFFLIVDGITFMLNPETTLPEMARNIILIILLAAASILITNLAAKTKDKKTITISLAIIAAGIFFYFYPDLIAAYMQLLLSLFIIYDGVTNIANILHLNDKLSKYTKAISRKYNNLIHRKVKDEKKKQQQEKFKDIDNNINEGLEQQKEKLITPLRKIINKTNKSSTLYIIANTASITFGIILLVYPDVSMMIWGLIFLYTGLSNFFIAAKTIGLVTKIKQKKFKEILFNIDNKQDHKQIK